jgi:hypothetical protein
VVSFILYLVSTCIYVLAPCDRVQRLAQESTKATRDDDIFDTDAMRGRWDTNGTDAALSEMLSEGMLEDLDLPTEEVPASSSVAHNGAAGGTGAGKGQAGQREDGGSEDEIVFGSSHVHKLQYKPQSARLGAPGKPKAVKAHSGGGVGKLLNTKTGRVNAEQIKKQAVAALREAHPGVGDSSEEYLSEDSEEGSEEGSNED